ncbi:MAG TPA: secondary thiamine-phosphate synthase enzyme YjbQ [Actinomycetota bacterium]
MATHTHTMKLQTRGEGDLIDLTDEVEHAVRDSGIANGATIVFVPGSTAGVSTIEYEPGLVRDTRAAFERLAPQDLPYAHNHGGDSNGHAHVRATLLGPSLTVPVVGGRLTLGTWQQIVLADFDDRPRSREVIVQIVGE